MTITATTSNPSRGTVVNEAAYWRRVGDTMEIAYDYRQQGAGSAGSGTYLFTIPGGYSADTSKLGTIPNAANAYLHLGTGRVQLSGTDGLSSPSTSAHAYLYDATRFFLAVDNVTTNNIQDSIAPVSSSFRGFGNSNVLYSFRKICIPISGWSSGSGSSAIYSLSDWTAYTPTVSGLGSTSNLSAFYRRVGDSLEVQGYVTIGSPAASLVSFTLPSGLLIDSSKVPVSNTTSAQGHSVGYIWGNDGSSGGVSEPIVLVTATGTSTSLVYAGKSGATANQLIPANGNAIYTNSNDPISFNFRVPIAGWTATASGTLTAPRSEITVDSGNGFGSTNTTVRRFTNTRKSVGSAVTYADSASNGASFTINETGVYAIEYHDQSSSGAATIGISVNSTALTTSPGNMTYAQGIRTFMDSSAASFGAHVHWTGNLNAGDIVRAQAGTAANSTNERCMFTITKVSN
jgi:hypothetical protein